MNTFKVSIFQIFERRSRFLNGGPDFWTEVQIFERRSRFLNGGPDFWTEVQILGQRSRILCLLRPIRAY